MKRAHRTAHRWLWLALTIALAAGVTAALTLRPPPDKSARQTNMTFASARI